METQHGEITRQPWLPAQWGPSSMLAAASAEEVPAHDKQNNPSWVTQLYRYSPLSQTTQHYRSGENIPTHLVWF